jgi:hypothetical protein
MSVRERIVDGDTRFGFMRIRSGDYDLIVESRELYSSYKIVRTFRRHYYIGEQTILYHSVRTPEPVPIRPAHIIHARRIPWFLWFWYLLRDAVRNYQFNRESKKLQKAEKIRIQQIRALAEKHMGEGRFKGRYNR